MNKRAPGNTGGVSKMRLRTWLAILGTANRIEKQLRELMRREYDITLPQFDVMSALYRNRDGLKMSELSGALKVSNGNVTGIVDRLVSDKMVVRKAVENDRRAQCVSLTRKGEKQFETYASAHEKWINQLLSSIDSSEAKQIIELLKNIATP